MKNQTFTRKIKIELIPQKGLTVTDLKSKLVEFQKIVFEASNNVMNELFFNELRKNRLERNNYIFDKVLGNKNLTKEKKKYYQDLQDRLNKEKEEIYNVGMKGDAISQQNVGYVALSTKFGGIIPTRILSAITSSVTKKFNNSIKDILTGKVTIPNYKRDCPIPINFKKDVKNFPLTKDEDGEVIFYPSIGEFNFKLIFGKDKSNNRSIVDKILSGNYKLGDSSISIKFKTVHSSSIKEIYFHLCFSIPEDQIKKNQEANNMMGIDLGINNPIAYAINGTKVSGIIGTIEQFHNHKIQYKKRRKVLQKTLTTGSVSGKGRKKKMRAFDNLKENEKNWTRTMCHTYSREIIRIAERNNVKLIKLEDLTNINTKDLFLKDWPYYILQSYIQYKAKRVGIDVLFIEPTYTSTTCKDCGEKGIRDKEKFICNNLTCGSYGIITNADINAAYVISSSENYSKKKNKNKELVEELTY